MTQIKFKEFYYKNKNIFFKNVTEKQWSNWKWQLKNSIRTFDDLIRYFPELNNKKVNKVCSKFPLSIPPYLLSLINFDNIKNDPIAKQIIPSINELINCEHLVIDPFNEKIKSPVKGIIKRYPDRILLVTTNNCASYCRYCTRKWNWNTDNLFTKDDLTQVIKYLKKNSHIREAIISGGDPFLLNSEFLEEIIKQLLNVSTIEVVRIATRVPSFLPQKIDNKIVNILKKYKPVWVITHFNHPDEITPETEIAIDKLISAGVSLANQTVLLQGINDNHETMKKLLYLLERLRIKPYYIFHCDLIEGTKHFRTSIDKGLKIIDKLRGNIGGLCIPAYVVDLPDGGKVPLLPEYIISENENEIVIKNYEGKLFKYPKLF